MKLSKAMMQQLEGWKEQKTTKLIVSQLEEMKEEYIKALIGGSLLDNQVRQAQLIGKLEIINMILQPQSLVELIMKVEKYDDESDRSVIDEDENGEDENDDRRDRSV